MWSHPNRSQGKVSGRHHQHLAWLSIDHIDDAGTINAIMDGTLNISTRGQRHEHS